MSIVSKARYVDPVGAMHELVASTVFDAKQTPCLETLVSVDVC